MTPRLTPKRDRSELSADATLPNEHTRTPFLERIPGGITVVESVSTNKIHYLEEATGLTPKDSRQEKEASKSRTARISTEDGTHDDFEESSPDQSLTKCSFCLTSLTGKTRHQCQPCQFIACSDCEREAEYVFQEHESHLCEEIPPSSSTTAGTAATTSKPPDSEPILCLKCSFCKAELRGVRMDCDQCPNVHLCEDDRFFHNSRHSLRRIDPASGPLHDTVIPMADKTGREASPCDEQRELRTQRPPDSDMSPTITILRDIDHDLQDEGNMVTSGDMDNSESSGEYNNKQSDGKENNEGDDEADAETVGDGERAEREDYPEDIVAQDGATAEHEGENGSSSVGYGATAGFDNRIHGFDASTAWRQSRRGPGGQKQQQPTHITLTVPITALARVIRDQAPEILLPHGKLSKAASPGRKHRRWLPEDKRRLRELKSQGKTNMQVAEALGRTTLAVGQQWSKQRLE